MIESIRAELLVLRKRQATWILLGIWTILAAVFAYIVPYMLNRDAANPAEEALLRQLLPDRLVGNISAGFPFYGGAFALMLGVLAVGSDYGWGTFKTLFTQGPGRLRVFGAKLAAIGLGLIPFVLLPFAIGTIGSIVVGNLESAAIDLPSLGLLARGLLASWLILLAWGAFGVLLAVLSRGTSLAIGVGILYTLALEGLLSALAGSTSLLDPLVKVFVRTNAYSLIRPLGAMGAGSAGDGPGRFAGPFVSTTQALLVLALYVVIFAGIAGLSLRRRDVA